MPTSTQMTPIKPRRNAIKPKRTAIQKTREYVLTLLDTDKVDIERATGVSKGILANIFTDRHRSPDAEAKVAQYLDSKTGVLGDWETKELLRLGFRSGTLKIATITVEGLGWPTPET